MLIIKNKNHAMTGVAQLVGHHPSKGKVASSVPSQGTCLCGGFGPQSGHVSIQEATNWYFSH